MPITHCIPSSLPFLADSITRRGHKRFFSEVSVLHMHGLIYSCELQSNTSLTACPTSALVTYAKIGSFADYEGVQTHVPVILSCWNVTQHAKTNALQESDLLILAAFRQTDRAWR